MDDLWGIYQCAPFCGLITWQKTNGKLLYAKFSIRESNRDAVLNILNSWYDVEDCTLGFVSIRKQS